MEDNETVKQDTAEQSQVAVPTEQHAPQQEQRPRNTYGGGNDRGRGRAPRRDGRRNDGDKDDLKKKTVFINRVTKVVKGGRNMRFSALMVVGDGNGKVGVGMGKSAEVSGAIEKATQVAKKNMFSIPMQGTTVPHEVRGKFGKSDVLMMPAKPGTGVIAGGPVRAVLELAGIKDIRTKSHGSNNPINCINATLNALKQLRTAEQIAALRGKTVEEILG